MAAAAASFIVVGILSKGIVPAAILGGVAGFQAATAVVHLATGVYEHMCRNRELAALDRGLRAHQEGRSNYRPHAPSSSQSYDSDHDERRGRFGDLRGGGHDHDDMLWESTAFEAEHRSGGQLRWSPRLPKRSATADLDGIEPPHKTGSRRRSTRFD